MRAIRAATASQAYKVLFWHLMEKGEPFISEDGAECRILDTVICHIDKPMDRLSELTRISPLGPLAMEQYRKDFVYGVEPDDPRPMDFKYTYHERLFEYGVPSSGVAGEMRWYNQIENIIHKLIHNQFTRRAIAVLWKPWEDITSSDPPCLDMIKFNISRDGSNVNMSCVFRSHDLIGGWIPNVYALTNLLKCVADGVSRDVGYLEIISFDGHAYMSDMDKIDRLKELLK